MFSYFSLITPVCAEGTAATASPAGSSWTIFIWLIPMALIFYFMAIRPQKKREKQAAEMRSSLNLGDEIVTIGGVCGRIIRIKDNTVTILTADSKMTFLKTAIGSVTKSTAAELDEEPAPAKKAVKDEDKPEAEAEETSPAEAKAERETKKKGLFAKKED
jgi:preprotein translocase subunit YajC